MKAEITTGMGSGGNRVRLVEKIPLYTPFAIDVFPIHACNFKCNYCIFSRPISEHGYDFETRLLEVPIFEKMIDDMQAFERKIKMLRFVGIGEPLLHPQITDMIKYASEKRVTEKIEIITNGSLLTHEMSDRLIGSGLTQIRVSLQGLSSNDYKNISDVNIEFDKLVDNIEYFYENKGNIILNLKIADISVDTEEKLEKFYHIFGNMADSVAVEKISPSFTNVDYSKYKFVEQTNVYTNMRGQELPMDIHICNFPFYLLQINPDGSVFPCCSTEIPPVMGNIKNQSIVEIWKGEVFNDFRRKMLDGVEKCGTVCSKCKAYRYTMFTEDIITDKDAENLKRHYL